MAAVTSSPATDVMFDNDWHPHATQYQLLKTGLKAPVYSKGLSTLIPGFPENHKDEIVYVPFLGDNSIKQAWQASGGNPLANEDREKLCLLISPVIIGFNYDDVFYGHVDSEDDELVTRTEIPSYFERNVYQTIDFTVRAFSQVTTQPYQILASKLNPLSSGKANIVMYIKFSHYCEFDRQTYYTPEGFVSRMKNTPKIRIIPKPYITKFGEPEQGYKFTFNFMNGDEEIYKHMFHTLQTFVERDLNLHLRHIKGNTAGNTLTVFTQSTKNSANDIAVFKDRMKNFVSKYKQNIAPYIITDMDCHEVEI
jgi:hypothetical protein